MKVVSWNINSLRKRQDRLFPWLETTKPDVVCLQETKCADEQFPLLALQAAGYHAVYHGEKSYNGVAILSKSAPADVAISLGGNEPDSQTRAIAATIDGVRVYSVYVPNGQAIGSEAYQYKLRWFARLRDRLSGKKSPTPSWPATSTLRRAISTCTTRIFGAAPSCAPMRNARL